MIKYFFALFLMLSPLLAQAKGDDLVNCRYNNGNRMDLNLCEAMRGWAARDAALEAQRAQAREDKRAKAAARQQQEQAQIDAVAKQKADEDNKRWDEERAVKKAEADKYQAEQEEEAAAAERIDAERRAACGKDYGNPRVGMTFKRAQQCVGDFHIQGQINRADGVVTTYRSGRAYVHVMNGKIVSWGINPAW